MFRGNRNIIGIAATGGRKEGFIMKKYCVKCGNLFDATGREVICPSCREAAKLEAKRAAVMRAKRASWNGESVPVRITGRASTLIRKYGTEKSLPFAAALDELLKASAFFINIGRAWEDITPFKSRRMKKSDEQEVTSKSQDVQAAQEVKQEVKTAKPVKQAAKIAVKTRASKAAGKAASKAVKTAGKKAGKAAK